MKRLLLIVLPLLLIVGCSQPIEDSTLINKYGIMYLPNSDQPFSGEVFSNYSTGEKLYQGVYENGLLINHLYFNEDGSIKEPINIEITLVLRDNVYFTKDTNKPYSGPVFSLNERGLIEQEGILLDGKMKNFKKIKWYDNGQKFDEENFMVIDEKGGFIPNGLWTQWYKNGQKTFYQNQKNGEYDGPFTYWFENGNIDMKGFYKDGKEDGLWTGWYENGQKKSEKTYKDGKEISSKEWNKDGSVKE